MSYVNTKCGQVCFYDIGCVKPDAGILRFGIIDGNYVWQDPDRSNPLEWATLLQLVDNGDGTFSLPSSASLDCNNPPAAILFPLSNGTYKSEPKKITGRGRIPQINAGRKHSVELVTDGITKNNIDTLNVLYHSLNYSFFFLTSVGIFFTDTITQLTANLDIPVDVTDIMSWKMMAEWSNSNEPQYFPQVIDFETIQ